ncbi:MAG: phage baseplate assembly protein [Azonexus sp.]|jgi:phage gp45-like|nr:phage baseplate assembly protein [Azonexus sp.]
MIGQIWGRLRLIFAHGVGLLISHDKIQARVLDDEVLGNLARVEPYGFSYRPKPGCQTYLLFPNGDRSYGVAIVVGDKRYQLALQEGEVGVHDDQGQKVHLTRSGIVIDGAGRPVTITNAPTVTADTPLLKCTGDIMDRCNEGGRTMAAMRASFDRHVHPENDGGGPTDPPTEGM